MATALKGKVKWFSAPKGYGFLVNEAGKDIFIHFSNIKVDGFKTLTEGQDVTYELGTGKDGVKIEAKNVTPISTESGN